MINVIVDFQTMINGVGCKRFIDPAALIIKRFFEDLTLRL